MITADPQSGVVRQSSEKTKFTINKQCEICGKTESPHTRMWYFPTNIKQCRQWLKYVGVEDLVYIPIEKLRMKQVCDDHFLPKHYSDNKHELIQTAIPLIGLTREPLSDEIFAEFPFHKAISADLSRKSIDENQTSFTSQSIEVYNNNIHEDLEKSWSKILCQGLPSVIKINMLNKYKIPDNCELLTAPSFNPRITNILPKSTIARDEVMKNNQQQLSLGIATIGKVLSALINDKDQKDSEPKLILTNACQILTDLHFMISQQRLSMLTGNENFTISENVKSRRTK